MTRPALPSTSTQRSIVASALVFVQAALVGLGGIVLVAMAARRRRRVSRRLFHQHLLGHPRLWGLVLLVVAAVLVAIGVGCTTGVGGHGRAPSSPRRWWGSVA